MADNIEAFLARLHHPVLAQIDLSLDRIHRLLAMLGSPHKRLPPVIHIAGTNGKGSLIANLQSIFTAGGYRVHCYTSPHLVHFRERIVLAGKEIDNAYLETILKHVASALASQQATFFEATTAAAFLAFAEKPADILLLETGMGGRLDATNVIEKPLLTAITPISLDHIEYLGNSIEAIAGEKAGILKRGVACVVGRQSPEAIGVIEAKAAMLAAPLFRLGKEWDVAPDGAYRCSDRRVAFTPALAGGFQYDNAAAAIACIDQLPQFSIDDESIRRGIASAVWPARLQRLQQGVFADILPPGIELWLDGGHNPQGGEMLAAWMKTQDKPVHLICGMIKGKDMKAFLALLAPYAASLQAIAIPGESNSQPALALAEAARSLSIDATASSSLESALKNLLESAKTPSILCICGSLYLAGKVLAANQQRGT
jgi:dihydrofolate synthase/folylpolyglutamate synthase